MEVSFCFVSKYPNITFRILYLTETSSISVVRQYLYVRTMFQILAYVASVERENSNDPVSKSISLGVLEFPRYVAVKVRKDGGQTYIRYNIPGHTVLTRIIFVRSQFVLLFLENQWIHQNNSSTGLIRLIQHTLLHGIVYRRQSQVPRYVTSPSSQASCA
jgi:hypothetical protein